ncbi:hypothetical protein [Azoarcus sp. DN11]|uniref:hypothetical protein n=1 Tax=Azoarcus sp. DN11 TaxID=356837 RepID=UPI00256FBB84|nr:hypothetical protein [Azoarcus sp. DN11]
MAEVRSHRDADPVFNWISRPEEAFPQNAAAAGFMLVLMTLAMNAVSIWIRYHVRKDIKW